MSLPVYDAVLLPAKSQYQRSIDVSEQLAHYGTDFTLANGRFDPHMSLYMANFTPEQLAAAKDALAKLAGRTALLYLRATDYLLDRDQGMFEIGYEKPAALIELQNVVVAALNPLRTGLRERDPVGHVLTDWLSQLTGEARDNYHAFGYDEIGGLFRPHITFTRFAQRDFPIDLQTLPPPAAFDTAFATLALYEMGDHGTCTRAVFSAQLAL